MNKFQLSIIVVLTVVLGGYFSLHLSEPFQEQSSDDKALLLPQLKSEIDQVDRIVIKEVQNKAAVTLNKTNSTWVVHEKDAYVAETAKVKRFLIQLSHAELLEAKTKKSEYFHRLGLADLTEEKTEGQGSVVELFIGDKLVGSAMIGKFNPGAVVGTFARQGDEVQAWLTSLQTNIDKSPLAWLDKKLTHIETTAIKQVTITPDVGEPLVVYKDKPTDKHFKIKNLPKDAVLKAKNAHNSVANGLRNFNFIDVVPNDSVDFSKGTLTNVSYKMFDGLVIDATLLETEDGDYYLRLKPRKDLADSAIGAITSEQKASDSDHSYNTIKDFSVLSERFEGRVYKIPNYKANTMNKLLADFIEEQKKEAADIKSPKAENKEGHTINSEQVKNKSS